MKTSQAITFNRVFRLATMECSRLLRRPRLWFLTAAVFLFGSISLLTDEFPSAELRLGGSLALGVPLLLSLMWSVVSGVAVGSSMAEDRRSGYAMAVMARGLTGYEYILGKALAMAAVPALIALFCNFIFYALLAIKLPWGFSVVHTAARDSPHWLDPLPGPSPYLFLQNPYLNDLLGIGIITLGAAAMGLTGVLVGLLTVSEPLAVATPAFLFVATAYLPRSLQFLSVNNYLDPWFRYRIIIPPSAWLYAGILYFILWGLFMVGAGLLLYHRKESL